MSAMTWENTGESGTIAPQHKTGRTVLVTPLPGPNPRIGRAPVNDAPSAPVSQQGAR